MPTSASFLEPTRTHLGWVRRVPHSDVTIGMLGGPSMLSPAEAMKWVGLDHRKVNDRAIWTYLCSGRVLLEGVVPDGRRHQVHYECRGAHRLDDRGAIAELPRLGAVSPPEGVRWGYEPTSVAELRRTADAPLVGGPNLADSLGLNIWMVGTRLVRSLDGEATEPPQRENRLMSPKFFRLIAYLRAADDIQTLLGALNSEPDDVLIQLYGAEAPALKRHLQSVPRKSWRKLLSQYASDLLRDRPEELGITPDQARRGKRMRAYSTSYLFYPAGEVKVDYDAVPTAPGTQINTTSGRIAEVQAAYHALLATGHVEELAPAIRLEELGVMLSAIMEAPTEIPPAFLPKRSPTPADGGMPSLAIRRPPGPVENDAFINLRSQLICAYIYPQYQKADTLPTSGDKKTCAQRGCGEVFTPEDGRERRCPAHRMGKAPDSQRKYHTQRQRDARERKQSDPGLSQ